MNPQKLDREAFPPDFTQQVLTRCIEVGDCLEWEGPYAGRTPVVMAPRACMPGSKMRPGLPRLYVSVRRSLMLLSRGFDPGNRTAVPRCNNWRCVRAEHVSALTREEHGRRMSSRARATDLTRGRRIAVAKRAVGKLNEQAVREIRESDESAVALAARYGVDPSYIPRIKRHEVWREYATALGSMAHQLVRSA